MYIYYMMIIIDVNILYKIKIIVLCGFWKTSRDEWQTQKIRRDKETEKNPIFSLVLQE